MAVSLHAQALVTVEEALVYIQDQGSPRDDNDLLRMHINAVTAFMLTVTNRARLLHVTDDTITEFRNGDGTPEIYLRDAPVAKITSVTLNPNFSTSTTVEVPTGSDTYSDQMYFEPRTGLLVLKNRAFPDGKASVKVVYEAGFEADDAEILGLKMIALDALASKWARWKGQRHGVDTETRQNQSVRFSASDFSKNALEDLRRYRRTLFA